jgi:hypothetical protein
MNICVRCTNCLSATPSHHQEIPESNANWLTNRSLSQYAFLNKIFEMSFCSLHQVCFFFLSLNISIGWQLYICNCCKPFFPLLYNCQLLCFWRLAVKYCSQGLPTALFPKYCSLKDVHYKLVMPNCIPYP